MKFLTLLRAIIAPIALACLVVHANAATLLPPGKNCFQATTGVNGMVGLLGTITGGSGGTSGTYGGVALTGGSGSGATANITVSGGAVTAVAILNPGTQYVAGDVLSASSATIGNVSGFSVPVSSTAINSSLAGGTVGFYIPGTLSYSQTWQNAAQTINNTNPVTLDANGCAIIYGEGTYRQILYDNLGNTVWDQLTTSTDTGGFYWAGAAGGTPNAITVTDPNFSSTAGQGIQFIAYATNTGATTLQVSGGAVLPIVKDTPAGPVALTGGEIAIGSGGQNNVVTVTYDATNTEFHLIGNPPGTTVEIVPYQGGFKNLTITNGSTPSVLINITADQLVLQNAAGATAKISSVNCNINISTNTFAANSGGMDAVGSESPISTWISVWAIYNPTSLTQSCLGSLSTTSPALPSGYTYAARFGWMLTDTSAGLRMIAQHGRRGHYVVTTGSTTPQTPNMASGSTGGPLIPIPLAAFVPPTATEITVFLQANSNGQVSVGGNAAYGTAPLQTTSVLGALALNSSINASIAVPVEIEGTNIYYASQSNTAAMNAYSWEDNL